MIAVPFFVLLFGIVESSLIFFAGKMLESSVDRVGRMLQTGEIGNAATVGAFRHELCRDAAALFDCARILIDVKVADRFDELGDPPLTYDNHAGYSSYSFTAPCPEEIVMVTASYEWPIITYFASDNVFRTVPGKAGNPLVRKILLNAVSVIRTDDFPAASRGRACI